MVSNPEVIIQAQTSVSTLILEFDNYLVNNTMAEYRSKLQN